MALTIDDLIQNLIANNNGKKDELITTIEKSANYGYKVAVAKACDLLRDLDVFTEDFINDFRKVMKGE